MDIDKDKVKLTIATVLWSALGSHFGQPLIHNNQDAINVIVTVFSVLAGFLVAIITLIGDPKSLPSGSWQKARIGSDLTYNRLVRHKWLFNLYLSALALVFISMLIKEKLTNVQDYIEYSYLFVSIAAFLLSFRLPSSLMTIQKERIEHEITERRLKENIESDN